MQDLLNEFLGAWLRSSRFWCFHAALSVAIGVFMPLAGALVCIACAAGSIMLAAHGPNLADRMKLP